MPRALIVSAGASSNEYLAHHVAEYGYPRPTIVPSCGEARRLRGTSPVQLVGINTPLPDEIGHELGLYAVRNTQAGVLLLVKASNAEQTAGLVEESGVLVLSKPFTAAAFRQGLHLAAATSRRLENLWQENERLRGKLEQTRMVCRAKCRLIQQEGMTEAQAHRYLEKLAMDTRRSLAQTAADILQQEDSPE